VCEEGEGLEQLPDPDEEGVQQGAGAEGGGEGGGGERGRAGGKDERERVAGEVGAEGEEGEGVAGLGPALPERGEKEGAVLPLKELYVPEPRRAAHQEGE